VVEIQVFGSFFGEDRTAFGGVGKKIERNFGQQNEV
jgi:hypothetical protein